MLSKIHLILTLPKRRQAFASYMGSMLRLIPLPQNVRDHWIVEEALGPSKTLAKKAEYIKKFKEAVRAKYADRSWVGDESKVNLVASNFLDSLPFAGGLSVLQSLKQSLRSLTCLRAKSTRLSRVFLSTRILGGG